MNQQICKAERVAPNHPTAMLRNPFFPDVHNRCCCDSQPNQIKQIEAHAAYFSSCGIGSHVAGGQDYQQNGRYVNVAVQAM